MFFKSKMQEIKGLPIDDLDFPIRIKNTLKQHDVFHVDQLCKLSPCDILKFKKFGLGLLLTTMESLAEYNLYLREDHRCMELLGKNNLLGCFWRSKNFITEYKDKLN